MKESVIYIILFLIPLVTHGQNPTCSNSDLYSKGFAKIYED
jgi:hypothetical protein